MSAATCSVPEFIKTWNKYGSPTLVAQKLQVSVRCVIDRRNRIQSTHGVELPTWNNMSPGKSKTNKEFGRIDLELDNGTVIVFSDAHYWPDEKTTMHRALLAMIKQIKPDVIVCNGDAFDGARISRWPRIGWDNKPTVKQELEAVQERLGEIEALTKCELIWPIGNHDARYETKLAAVAPEFEGLQGFSLKDHFPLWKPCWTFWINGDTCITHFYHTGVHATHNNVVKGQCHFVTGHTHSLKVTPWTGAAGQTVYGVDTGCLAESLGQHNLDYQQGRHGNHRSGFAVLTWRDGKLLMPELCQKWDDDHFVFRGHVLNADTGEVT